jgi:hypothetical protein
MEGKPDGRMDPPTGAVMRVLLSAFLELDFQTFIGGHTLDIGGSPRDDSGGDSDGGAIGTGPIVAVVLLTLVTAGLLVWLSPARTAAKVKTVGRGALIVAVITLPLIVWAGSSGGDDEEGLKVERSTSRTGAPEFIVSLGDEEMNTLATNNGKRSVRLECRGQDGEVVLDAQRKWPFRNKELGYDYPHTHQRVSWGQLQQADRCRLRGLQIPLEADVEGALTG